ncbi:hypothetical protein [uncultured Psychroserpens sp.]|uniref:hypothetical protein n=1 Tax=uncultured Psychroserpens sp. TaxID=255436 RepID=UPI00261D6D97|nr:hypothetical protein [uncultured Psychroserpens sp.]
MAKTNVALTINSIRSENTVSEIVLDVKGGTFFNHMQPPYPPKSNQYWMVIFDRRSLKVVENFQFSNNSAVPSQISKYQNDTNFFYVLTTQLMSTPNLPTGPFYKWLRAEGAGKELTRIEQAAETLNCGSWSSISYTLVDIFGPKDSSTFEFSGLETSRLITTLELAPIDISGTTYYSPIELRS